MQWFRLLAVVGILLSAYATHVEHSVRTGGPGYKALCDIGGFSCSSVFTSKYGSMVGLILGLPKRHILNQPNAVYGIIFYATAIVAHVLGLLSVTLFLTAFSSAGNFLLGYLLYAELGDLCIVCTSIYVVNFLMFYASYREWSASGTAPKKAKAGGKGN